MEQLTGIIFAVLGIGVIAIGFVVFGGVGFPHPLKGDLAVVAGLVLLGLGAVDLLRRRGA
jgi:hypothetical protein